VKGDSENAKKHVLECIDVRRELLGAENKELKDAEHLLHEITRPKVINKPQVQEEKMKERDDKKPMLSKPIPKMEGGMPPPPPPPPPTFKVPRSNLRSGIQQQPQQMSHQSEMLNFDRRNMRHNSNNKEYEAGKMAKKMQGFNKRKIALKKLY